MIDILNQEPRKSLPKPKKRYVEISEEANSGDETDGSEPVYGPPSDIESVCGQFYDGRKQLRWAGTDPATRRVSRMSPHRQAQSLRGPHLGQAHCVSSVCKNQEEMYSMSSPW